MTTPTDTPPTTTAPTPTNFPHGKNYCLYCGLKTCINYSQCGAGRPLFTMSKNKDKIYCPFCYRSSCVNFDKCGADKPLFGGLGRHKEKNKGHGEGTHESESESEGAEGCEEQRGSKHSGGLGKRIKDLVMPHGHKDKDQDGRGGHEHAVAAPAMAELSGRARGDSDTASFATGTSEARLTPPPSYSSAAVDGSDQIHELERKEKNGMIG